MKFMVENHNGCGPGFTPIFCDGTDQITNITFAIQFKSISHNIVIFFPLSNKWLPYLFIQAIGWKHIDCSNILNISGILCKAVLSGYNY